MSDKLAKAGKFAALAPVEDGMGLSEIVNINMGGGGIDPSMLDKVKVPAGGSLTWEVPSLEGDTEPHKELIGVIVGIQNIRTYYATKFDGGNEPPDCFSRDGLVGEPSSDSVEGYGGRCSECPKAQWGSGENGGQACAQRKLVLHLMSDAMLPIVVTVPPSSLKELDRYLLRLTSKRTPFYKVVSSLKLSKEKSKGGIEYARIAPAFIRMLDEDEAEAANNMFHSLHAVFGQVAEDAAADCEI